MKFLKSIMGSIVLLCLFAIPAFAVQEILNVDINSTTYVPITIEDGVKGTYYAVQTRSIDTPCYFKKSLSDTVYWTIKANTTISLPTRITGKTKILGYVKADITTDVLELILVQTNN
ncbi:MAG: hypothetical protein GY861_11540 [bacterium]|nr:hypothetical protein [bacterium]